MKTIASSGYLHILYAELKHVTSCQLGVVDVDSRKARKDQFFWDFIN